MNNSPDQKVLDQLIGRVVGEVASAMGVFMAYLGDQAGVYQAMDEAGPSTVEELSSKTGLNPKYLHCSSPLSPSSCQDSRFYSLPSHASYKSILINTSVFYFYFLFCWGRVELQFLC